MVISGYILLFLGLLAALVGDVMFLTVAYKRSLWWFFGCLFLPPVDIVFLLLNLKTTFKPFAMSTTGLMMVCIGGWLAGIEWPT
ncbi:MAG: hypothetical protein HY298_22660 [Verrucomicrobia bacterium]|nr:hypothetical protein [Verrucomicrobiota bacterium]